MPPPPAVLVRVAMQTCAAAVALACGFLMHRDVRMNVYTLEASIDFESMLHEPCYNAWFSRHLRCSQTSFAQLCSILRVHFPDVPYEKYSFERAVACMLFHLGSSGGYRETAQALGVSKAWCIVQVNALVLVLNSLRTEHIKSPTPQHEWDAIADASCRKRGFPFCGGAIDGTLIAIKRPADFEGWYNRKDVQAVCDHLKRFISFDIRPGSWSDSKVFQHSRFGRNIDRLLPRGFHDLADSGYGIGPVVMTPYSAKDEGGLLTRRQTRYNFYHSSTRMVVEGAFGLLKERFRILKKTMEEHTPEASVKLIVACLVLHNMLINFLDKTEFEDDDNAESTNIVETSIQDRNETKQRVKIGKQKRDDIASIIF